ncbi:hypothetical protein EPH_0072180 [Eimeria praecox]|uniref:Uncharacterized protein n=1 Tax=Eimeria praecox TaxID=51316 RepID=U6H662_9EIME|nr:hypothetical protein EPH_0072180 [Eimeria praecox]
MNLTADCLQPGGQPSGENWDAKVVPESEMLIRLSYGDQASPVRAAWSGRPSEMLIRLSYGDQASPTGTMDHASPAMTLVTGTSEGTGQFGDLVNFLNSLFLIQELKGPPFTPFMSE